MLVTPSFYEGFGLPPLEAMACGTPTVVSNRGALPEVVGTAGLVVDLDQADALSMALHRALTDEAWRTESRRAGLARAALYTWQHTAQIAIEAYQHNQT